MLDKLSLKLKLVTVIAIPIIAVIIVTAYSIFTVNDVFSKMKGSIFDEHLQSTTLILNADRDMYQALTAMQQIIYIDNTGENFDKQVKSFEENVGQVIDRSSKIKTIMELNKDMWSNVKDDKTQKTIFEIFASFDASFKEWTDICKNMIKTQSVSTGWTDKFDESRELINSIGEAIDKSAETQMSLIENEKDSMSRKIVIIDIVALLLAIGLSLIFLRMISRSLKNLREAAEEIALGKTNVNMNIKSNDEIGKLSDAFGKMIDSIVEKADAAENIAQGNLNVEIKSKSDDDILAKSMKSMIVSLKMLSEETSILTRAAIEGRLDTRGNAESFNGGYKEILLGINNTLDAVIEPIKESSRVLQEIAKGNLQVRVQGNYRGDHAEIKTALNETAKILSSYVNEISEVLNEMAGGNLNVSITNEYKGDFSGIRNSLNLIIESLNEVLSDLNMSARQVASGARQVSDSSQSLSQGATEQAGSVEEITASMTQVAAQTKQNALSAGQANELAVVAKENAEQGNRQMKDMLKSMSEINEASSNISKIIKVIDEIAFQTNILALNAAVEAARAGQHGKGFAVVAEEVRNLAARSASAAKETTSLIEGSIKKVESGTKLATDTANALDKIVDDISKAANLVGEIAIASNEQASGISQINQAINEVSQVIQTNSATSQQGAAASEELSSQSEVLKELVSKFKLQKKSLGAGSLKTIDSDILNMLGYNVEKKTNKKDTNTGTSKPHISLEGTSYGKY
ncbi:MAG: methyl-accepting chemotaxis protein [Clostridia bacterium]|nr:methyl-accepting chemotaxis protein [Clostridia bacterium]